MVTEAKEGAVQKLRKLSCCLVLGTSGILGASSGALAASTQLTFDAGIRETLTDNVGAGEGGTGSSGDDADSDLITELNVGAHANLQEGHLQGQFSIGARSQTYLEDNSRNTSFIVADGNGVAELIDKLLFVDLGGSVKRENTSAFGRTSVDDSLDTGNRSIVRRFFVMPRAQFRIGSEIQANASYRRDWTSGSDAIDGTRRSSSATLGLANPLAYGPFGWNLSYVRDKTEDDARTGSADQRNIRATLSYRASSQLMLRLIWGHESNDYETGTDQSNTIRGAGFDWSLSPRTQVNVTVEKRFFGTGFDYNIAYSRPLSSFQVRYSRDLSSVEDSQLLSLEEIAFRDFFTSLESSIPDAAERELVSRSLAQSIPNGDSVFANFVTSSFSVSRRLQLSASLVGARNVLSIGLTRSDSERLGSSEGLSAGDDFSRFSDIETQSISVSLSHRVSGRSSLSAGFSANKSEGSGGSSEDVTRRSLTLAYNTRIGSRTNGAISVRRQRSTGTTEFTENALVASLSMNF